MRKPWKIVLFVLALAIGVSMAVVLVRAATPGQDFEWLSVSQGGVLIGMSGGEGEGEGEAFIPPPNMLTFAEGFGAVAFFDGGVLAAVDDQSALAAGLFLQTPEQTGSIGSSVLVGGHVAMASGYLETEPEGEGEEEMIFVPSASVSCTPGGDVIIQLGPAQPPMESQETLSREESAPTSLEAHLSTLSESAAHLPIRFPRIQRQSISSQESEN